MAIALAVAALLALPVAAEGQSICGCARTWAHHFVKNKKAQRTYTREWRRQLGTSKKREHQRKVIKQRIYDWEKEGVFPKQPWCKRHPKLCKALASCLIAAGYTYATDRANGVSVRQSTIYAAGACATAATTYIVVSGA